MNVHRREVNGTHSIRVYFEGANYDVDIEYRAKLCFCNEEGDGFNEPQLPAHWELDELDFVDVTAFRSSFRDTNDEQPAIVTRLLLGQHILDQLDQDEVLKELKDGLE